MTAPHTSGSSIRLLPPHLANRIAAGEVVERPASIVKELVENSLDAGARRVRVELERGGQGRILVADDGAGIAPDELALAVTRHATSKLEPDDDLSAIASFGFRGEALASIASVAELTISSTREGAEEGAQLEVRYGRVGEVLPAPPAPGTRVEVRELFANVPARLKFLKTPATELKRAEQALVRLALAHPQVGLELVVDGRASQRFAPDQDLAARLAQLWPPQICQELTEFGDGSGALRVHGLAGSPRTAQPRPDRMLFYVNGRPVQDKLLLGAVRQAYAGRLLSRESPQIVLFLEMPLDEVDVNVHPAKLEVRFAEESRVFALIRRAVARALDHSLGGQPMGEEREEMGRPAPAAPVAAPQHAPLPFGPGLNDREEIQEERSARVHPRVADTPRPYPELQREDDFEGAPASTIETADTSDTFAPPQRPRSTPPQSAPADRATPPVLPPLGPELPGGMRYLGQVLDTYLVLSGPGGELVLLDQHAAHERVLYERMRAHQAASRPLALPLELRLHPAEAERLQELWRPLKQLGFALSQPRPGVVSLLAVPAQLAPDQAAGYLREVLEERVDGLDGLWAVLSCRAALKAGEPLAPAEAAALLDAWAATPQRDYCPHGRPTLLRFGARELERLFKRRT